MDAGDVPDGRSEDGAAERMAGGLSIWQPDANEDASVTVLRVMHSAGTVLVVIHFSKWAKQGGKAAGYKRRGGDKPSHGAN